MKNLKTNLIAVILSGGILLSGCEAAKNTNKTQRGAAIGAAAGAILGGVLGNNTGSKDNGALAAIIGAVVGGAAGGVIGNKMDKQAQEIEQTLPGAEVIRTAEGIQVILDDNSDVKFEYNKSSLTSQAKENLNGLISIFNQYPDTNIMVLGFTDSKGSDEYNLTLSKKRANEVVTYLTAQGIDSSRLSTKGMGETEPRGDNETEAGRAQNRRVEFAITANEKMIEEAKNEAGE